MSRIPWKTREVGNIISFARMRTAILTLEDGIPQGENFAHADGTIAG
jgi:hypothetical protein